MSKNVVLFFDGTWNGEPHPQRNLYPTNVYKLFEMASKNSDRQVTEYFPGVGTTVGQRVRGGTLGYGMSRSIIAGYQFIVENYEEGDRLFLIGFSRGAATARIVASWLDTTGLLPKDLATKRAIDEVYSAYRRWCSKRNEETERYIRVSIFDGLHTTRCPVYMMGIWDSVASVGVPVTQFYKRGAGGIRRSVAGLFAIVLTLFRGLGERPKFHDLRVSRNVLYAYQALAIDEEREAFMPIICDPTDDYRPTTQLRQVWFPGMHADVGGGYRQKELSDISLEWMMGHAVKRGLRIFDDPKRRAMGLCTPNPDGHMHDSRDDFLKKLLYRKRRREWSAEWGQPVIHESVELRTASLKNVPNGGYQPWIMDRGTGYEVEPWTHLKDWIRDPNFKHEKGSLEALAGWCEPRRPDEN